MVEHCDHLVIGGGVYGSSVATGISEQFPNSHVILAEKEPDLFMRATTNNHGRLHWGYQYPLHPQTAIQSRRNIARFVEEYSGCVNFDVESYYAIHQDSRVSPHQYESFCEDTGLSYEKVERPDFFGHEVVATYQTSELTFSNTALQRLLKNRMSDSNVDVITSVKVDSLRPAGERILAIAEGVGVISARNVFNCTYSDINTLHQQSGIPLIPSTHETYALFKVELPEQIRNTSATVIYGPYASIVSNNEVGTHILAHVTHSNCLQSTDLPPRTDVPTPELISRYRDTLDASQGFLPVLLDGEYNGEIVEVKSVYGTDPTEGERRVQTFPDYSGIPNYHVIFGGKMNSFYDAASFAVETLQRN